MVKSPVITLHKIIRSRWLTTSKVHLRPLLIFAGLKPFLWRDFSASVSKSISLGLWSTPPFAQKVVFWANHFLWMMFFVGKQGLWPIKLHLWIIWRRYPFISRKSSGMLSLGKYSGFSAMPCKNISCLLTPLTKIGTGCFMYKNSSFAAQNTLVALMMEAHWWLHLSAFL